MTHIPHFLTGKESVEEHPPTLHPPTSSRTPSPQRPLQYLEARGESILQSPPTRPQSPQTVRHKWRSEEDPGNQIRSRFSTV